MVYVSVPVRTLAEAAVLLRKVVPARHEGDYVADLIDYLEGACAAATRAAQQGDSNT